MTEATSLPRSTFCNARRIICSALRNSPRAEARAVTSSSTLRTASRLEPVHRSTIAKAILDVRDRLQPVLRESAPDTFRSCSRRRRGPAG
jgi:hypothetical protein